ncbi:olfactory receptor 6F1-like [Ambystoma mexicanum]|uniref:olfactory receptor 6F1-like n=1 Tax=Ambystoma mexicanum TaxID=8296 RepID=UPI0037E9004D
MAGQNQTLVTEFLLIGFPGSSWMQLLTFIVFFSVHTLTIAANMVIILIVRVDRRLCCTPMYIFLSHLAFLEIWYTTVTVPKMLFDMYTVRRAISFAGCFVQVYFFFALGLTEMFLLAAMAYDRYAAICHPLRYNSIMTCVLCRNLSHGSWLGGFITGLMLLSPQSTLDFCGSLSINHFFCDIVALLKLSCSVIHPRDIVVFSLIWIIILHSLFLTLVSYSYIVRTIRRIPSATGRWKAVSTCASHLTVVLTFYGTVIFMYLRPICTYNFQMDKVVSVFYAVVTPLLNPMVYTLRNMEFRNSFRKAWMRRHKFNQGY